jgi:hypothetical protein
MQFLSQILVADITTARYLVASRRSCCNRRYSMVLCKTQAGILLLLQAWSCQRFGQSALHDHNPDSGVKRRFCAGNTRLALGHWIFRDDAADMLFRTYHSTLLITTTYGRTRTRDSLQHQTLQCRVAMRSWWNSTTDYRVRFVATPIGALADITSSKRSTPYALVIGVILVLLLIADDSRIAVYPLAPPRFLLIVLLALAWFVGLLDTFAFSITHT